VCLQEEGETTWRASNKEARQKGKRSKTFAAIRLKNMTIKSHRFGENRKFGKGSTGAGITGQARRPRPGLNKSGDGTGPTQLNGSALRLLKLDREVR